MIIQVSIIFIIELLFFIINFYFKDELPSIGAIQAIEKLLECGVNKNELDRNYKLLGGRQVITTASPGLALYAQIQDWYNWVSKP